MNKFKIFVKWSEEDKCYISYNEIFPSIECQGNSEEEAILEMKTLLPQIIFDIITYE